MSSTDLDTVTFVNLATGERFERWESLQLQSEFLTPCDSWTLDAGAEVAGPELAQALTRFNPSKPRAPTVQILVNDIPQITGFVDECTISVDRGGTKVHVAGRDILGPVVSGNVDPRMPIAKETTIAKLVSLVIKEQFGYDFLISEEDGATHIGTAVQKRKKYESKHARGLTIKDIKPHDNEGAFSYLSRILTHYGYWLYASPDGTSVIIAGPDFEQPASYQVTARRDPNGSGAGRGNNIEKMSFALKFQDQPSVVYVRGVDSGAGTKGKIVGMSVNSAQPLMVPAYICDKDAKTKEQAERIAQTFLARKRRDFLVYSITVAGFSDRTPGATMGAIYQTNTVIQIEDELTGTSGPMWIESRTFRKGRDGCFTDLKCIPLWSLLLDWQPGEQPREPIPYPITLTLTAATAPGKAPDDYGGTIWDDLGKNASNAALWYFRRKQ